MRPQLVATRPQTSKQMAAARNAPHLTLNVPACRVKDCDSTKKRDAHLQHDAPVALLLRTRLLQLLELAIRQVTTREDDKGRDQVHGQRQQEREAPGQVDILARGRHHDVEHDRGEGVRDTTTEVAPAGRGGVGGTDLRRSGRNS